MYTDLQGKSLSIICGAIKWLKDHKELEKEQLFNDIFKLETEKQNIEETDWLTAQTKEIAISKRLNELKLKESKIKEYEKKIQNLNNRIAKVKNKFPPKNKTKLDEFPTGDIEDDDNIVIKDPDIEQDELSDEENFMEIYEPIKVIKIIYCNMFYNQKFL